MITPPERFHGSRSACTSIYFLIESGNPSHFHRIKSDELWHFHDGSEITIYEINKQASLKTHLVDNPNLHSQDTSLQVCVPAESWFAAEVNSEGAYSLVSCTVAPGFEFDDFELAQQENLLSEYPQYNDIIKRLAKPK